jgi:alpha-methylacyl-CoA racemase
VPGDRLAEPPVLCDFKVLSLALNVPGCTAAERLKQFGAQVTKVEPPTGDPMMEMNREWYAALTQGMRILRLDLKEPSQREHFDELLGQSDLLLTSMRLAALARLGLGWEKIHSQYPTLCQVAMTGYPAPQENRPGHDLTYQAEVGLLSPPELPRTILADLAGVERATSVALALLLARQREQAGGYAEVSLLEAGRAFAAPLHYGLTAPGGILGGGLPGYNLYQAQSGWVAVATLEGHFQKKLLEALELTSLDALAQAFQERTAEEWERWARQRDLPISAVRQAPKPPPAEEESQPTP